MQTKLIQLLLLVSLTLTSCSSIDWKKITTKDNGNIEVVEPIETPIEGVEEVEIEDVTEDKNTLKVISFTDFNKKQLGHFWLASAAMDKAINSQCYEDYILGARLYNNKLELRSETIKTIRGKKPALKFVMYYANNSTVGYTYPKSDTIWMNKKFHDNYSVASSSANLGHEIAHKLGYTHDFNRTAIRQYQFPYVHGAAIRKCVINSEYKLPVTVPDSEVMPTNVKCKRVWWKAYLGSACYKVVQ